jgi:hypothetical protein
VGALMMRDLIPILPETQFHARSEFPFLMGPSHLTFLGRNIKIMFVAAANRLPFFNSARLIVFKKYFLMKHVEGIARAARDTQCECIWAALGSPEMILISKELVTRGYDLRATIFDIPEHILHNLRITVNLKLSLMQDFDFVVRSATSIHVNGIPMQNYVAAKGGTSCEIIRHGIDVYGTHGRTHPKTGPVRIAFAGSLYSKAEWNALIHALDLAGWRIGDRPVLLHFIGRFPMSGAKKPSEVIDLGEKSFDETMRTLSTMHVGYLPYWFDGKHEMTARTSFPGKLSAYAAAGLAVFHHGPSYAGPTVFLEKHFLEELGKAIKLELSKSAMGPRFRRFMKTRVP